MDELKRLEEAVKSLGMSMKDEVVDETKAGVINTAETNHGKEVVRLEEQSHTLLDLLPQFSKLLPLLPGNHGTGLAISEKLPMLSEAALFTGNSEWTSGDTSFTASATYPKTSEAVITQGQFILEIPVSKREANYEFVNLENLIRERIASSFARTIDAYIINADSATSGNVNGTYASTAYYAQGNNGLRKLGIANTVTSVGTMSSASYLSVISNLGDGYKADLENLLIIEPDNVYMKTLQLAEVITNDKFGPDATIHNGVLAKIWGVDIMTARDFPSLTAATGLVSGTASDNTKGSFVVLWKPAVQYGFGQPLEIEVTKVAGRGYVLTATAEFGFTIVNNDANAGVGKTVAMGANITM